MVSSMFNQLPTELFHLIFSHLPISSLLAFAQTSQSHYALATYFLSNLELAIFPKRIHSMLAFLEEECRTDSEDEESEDEGHEDENEVEDGGDSGGRGLDTGTSEDDRLDSHLIPIAQHHQPLLPSTMSRKHRKNAELYQIGRTSYPTSSPPVSPSIVLSGHDRKLALRAACQSNPSPISLRNCEIAAQNDLATTILTSRFIRQKLRSLTLHVYTMQSSALAAALSTLSSLQYLNLNFSHPYINDTTLPASYWRTTPSQGSGSPIWNLLAGIGRESASSLTLRGLRTLILRRAGITSYQLRCWIMMNPHLEEIQLEKVRGVDREFTDWLARHISSQYRHQQPDIRTHLINQVVLKDCSELICRTSTDFDWINVLSSWSTTSQNSWQRKLKVLSLCGCKHVDEALFCTLAGLDVDEHTNGNTDQHRNNNHEGALVYHHREPEANKNFMTSSHLESGMQQTSIPSKWSAAIRKLISPEGIMIKDGKKSIRTHERREQLQIRHGRVDMTRMNRRTGVVSPPAVESRDEEHQRQRSRSRSRPEQEPHQEGSQQQQPENREPVSRVLVYRRRRKAGSTS